MNYKILACNCSVFFTESNNGTIKSYLAYVDDFIFMPNNAESLNVDVKQFLNNFEETK